MKKLRQQGFSAIIVLLVLILVAIIGFAGYYVYNQQNKEDDNRQTAPSTAPAAAVAKEAAVQKNSSRADLIISAQKELSSTPCPDAIDKMYSIEISKFTDDGWAELAGTCEGSATTPINVWKLTDNSWAKVISYQTGPWCDMVVSYKISSSLYPYCLLDTTREIKSTTLTVDQAKNGGISEANVADKNFGINPN